MSLQLSKFGQKFTQPSGIHELMKDLGEANASLHPDLIMLGGGNPAHIDAAQAVFGNEMQALLKSRGFESMIGLYDGPQGATQFREVLCEHLNSRYGWAITPHNISLTNGSQNSFFYIFNAIAGEMPDGAKRKILFPLAPEYVGYADAGLSDGMFASNQPNIELLPNDQFKYRVDFEHLEIAEDTAALCLSRPTNPTGNVVSDAELAKLDALASEHQIPLIIDNAYGLPFPGVMHVEAKPHWHDNIIMCMSLSKLGLPGARTGIVIASEEMTQLIASLSGIITLAPNSVGAALMSRVIQDGEIDHLTQDIIKPFYAQKLRTAQALVADLQRRVPVKLHRPEGAFFLWLWCEGLPISSRELYQRLKQKLVFVIPGEEFFIGIDRSWKHTQECIRINYAVPEDKLKRGLEVIEAELLQLYA